VPRGLQLTKGQLSPCPAKFQAWRIIVLTCTLIAATARQSALGHRLDQLGILFATGLLIPNALAGWAVLVGIAIRIAMLKWKGAAASGPMEVLAGIVTVTGGVQRVGEGEPRFMRRQPHLASGRLLRL
jgi:hypothetical protein